MSAISPGRDGAYDVELRAVTKRFGSLTAVDAINLKVRKGEFLSLLGPSGCGKTTSLRLIAGFEQPDEGEVLIGGKDAVGTPPYRRDVNTVFQHYALFPHMSVLDNVAYGLNQRKVGKSERHARAREALELVQMTGRETHRPSMLSGGQQQRVALARALVMSPRVLLLDEPLGALDLKLRKEMQIELKRIQDQVGITFIYVTHDQGEALSMSDRVAVMSNGVIEQLDEPRAIYDRPLTPFVAHFIGDMNFLTGDVVEAADGGFAVDAGPGNRGAGPRPGGQGHTRARRHQARTHGGRGRHLRRPGQLGQRPGHHQDVPGRPDPDRGRAAGCRQRRRARAARQRGSRARHPSPRRSDRSELGRSLPAGLGRGSMNSDHDELSILAPRQVKPKLDYLHREVQRAAGRPLSRRQALGSDQL